MYSGYLFHTLGAALEKRSFTKRYLNFYEVPQEGFLWGTKRSLSLEGVNCDELFEIIVWLVAIDMVEDQNCNFINYADFN